jgi:hypothetical protein
MFVPVPVALKDRYFTEVKGEISEFAYCAV